MSEHLKTLITYPPLPSKKGYPLLSQNRQFQWFRRHCPIYPVVPAQAATLLQKNGFKVIWKDGIAEEMRYAEWLEFVKKIQPNIVVMETKTPTVKRHWKITNALKKEIPALKTILVGDHVTALPEESFQNSKVDFVLTGGDYDFLLLNFLQNLKPNLEPVPQNLEPGIYYRDNEEIKNTGKFALNHNLNTLPFIDRELTEWQNYAYDVGNFSRTPGTYIMAGRDCWHHECTFCSWTTLYPKYHTRTPENVLDEIGELIKKYQIKEIMDDTGTFPIGEWLQEFCRGMIERGYNKKVILDCNMRFGALNKKEYGLMRKANFRFLLFGLESASEKTLNKISKNMTVEKIISSCKLARKTGLSPHVTIMFGYPWETEEEARQTVRLGKYLLRKGYAKTLQATIVIPYPGTPLFRECQQKKWLTSEDWNRYDMREAIMQTSFSSAQLQKFVQDTYKVAFHPEFILRQIVSLRDLNDLKYLARGAKAVFSHLADFEQNY
ncbi:MAG: radical SAM protein [Patescibacteria group bacterium]|nr:radical SAM protein [Patescibacteria group bacterium]